MVITKSIYNFSEDKLSFQVDKKL